MKKLFFLLSTLLAIGIIFSCAKEEQSAEVNSQNLELRDPGNGNTVPICHFDEETGEYHTIYVNENAVKAHLKHGDYEGECTNCCFGTWIDNYSPSDIFNSSIEEDEVWIRFNDGAFAVVALFSHRGCAGPAPWCGGCSPIVGSVCSCGTVDQDGNPVEGPIASEAEAMACRNFLIRMINAQPEAAAARIDGHGSENYFSE